MNKKGERKRLIPHSIIFINFYIFCLYISNDHRTTRPICGVMRHSGYKHCGSGRNGRRWLVSCLRRHQEFNANTYFFRHDVSSHFQRYLPSIRMAYTVFSLIQTHWNLSYFSKRSFKVESVIRWGENTVTPVFNDRKDGKELNK